MNFKNPKTNEWVLCPTDFSKTKIIKVFNIEVPVISKEELVNYKSILALGWPHQKQDVQEIIKAN